MNDNYKVVSLASALPHPKRQVKRNILTILGILVLFILFLVPLWRLQAAATMTSVTLPWKYTFNQDGILNEVSNSNLSGSPYWWLEKGGQLTVNGGLGQSLQGEVPTSNKWNNTYGKLNPEVSDNGSHPQNTFSLFLRYPLLNTDQSVSVKINNENLENKANRNPWNGILLMSRWQDNSTSYYSGIRADGLAIIKKKINGVYYTLAQKIILPGTWNVDSTPNLIPENTWMRLRTVTYTDLSGNVHIQLYTDMKGSGNWQLVIEATDNGSKGAAIKSPGLLGIKSDFTDIVIDNYSVNNGLPSTIPLTPLASTIPPPIIPPLPTSTVPPPTVPPLPPPSTLPTSTNYDSVILNDKPVMYLTMSSPESGSENDKSGNGNNGSYKGGIPTPTSMPNGDTAATFDGVAKYLTVPSSSELSIATTKQMTWEAWIRPDTLQFSNDSGYGYIDWMGKCQDYGPTCEWEARMYSTTNAEGRTNRLSAYVFNPSAGLGSAADWQPSTNIIQKGKWLHVVGEYQVITTPSGCSTVYPGSINIWVNGVPWNPGSHFPTGCMSQYKIIPKSNSSALNVGTMAMETWFKGAIGKVAIYDRLLTQAEISEHYQTMTGLSPNGSCGDSCNMILP